MKEWVEELKAQLEDHDNLVIVMETDEGSGTLMITNVQYDSELDTVVMKVA